MTHHENIAVSKRLVALNSASSVAAKLLNLTVLLWMYQYLLRRVPPEEFAVYPVVAAIMVFAPLFFSLFSSGISRYVIESYAKGEFERVTRIVSSIFPLLAAASAVFLAAGALFVLNIERILSIAPQMVGPARIMMGLLIVGFALQMLALPFTLGFDVRQRYVELNLLEVLRDVLRSALLFVLLLGIGPQVVWVVVATVIANAVYLAAVVLRSRRMLPGLSFRWRLFDLGQARALMSFGLWTTLGQLGTIMYTNAATIILNLYGTAVDVTSYHLGATVFRQLLGTIHLAARPLQPALTAMHALDDHRRFRNTMHRGGRYALWVSLAVAVPLAIYAREFITLYLGDRYPDAATVIIFFMVMFPFTQPNALLSKAAIATARVREFFLPAFLFLLAGLGLMLYFTIYHNLGAVGVTLSLSGITIGSQLLYFWPLQLRLTEDLFEKFVRAVLVPGLAPAAAGAVVWFGLKLLLPPASWLLLGLEAMAGGLVYLAVLLAFCLSSDERSDLQKVTKRLHPGRRSMY